MTLPTDEPVAPPQPLGFTAMLLSNRHAVWAMVIAVVVVGLVAYGQIPVRLFPDTAPPLVNVVTSWPGATAADVDRELSDPLETEFAALEGVARTSSTSQDNVSVVQVEFHYGTDVRMAAVDVDNAVSRLGSDLPQTAEPSRVMTFSTADRPVYTVGVRADDLLVARRLAEDVVAPRLQAIEGVAAVDVFGGRIPTVLVEVDPARAEAHRVGLQHVAGAIRTTNISAPAGRVRNGERETMLRVDERAKDVASLGSRVIASPDGGQVRLDNVATIRHGATDDDAWFSVDGQAAIAVQVYRSEDANTVEVVRAVAEAVEELGLELPELAFVPGEESASFTELSVSNLLGNVWQALLLASLILFFFLGRARAGLVTAFTMPLAFGLTFAVMWLMGMEFNMVTLSAVILAVGMVVDASVVVLENIVRLRDAGLSPVDAALRGADEVRMPVLAGVATTIVVLLPLLGLPGFVGKVFAPLATTLLIAFSSSVLVALVLVPILSLSIRDGGSDGGRLEAISARITLPFQRAMDALRGVYLRMLDLGLRFRVVVLGIAGAAFAIGTFGLLGAGMNLLPRMDSGTFSVALETPSGSPLSQTTEAVKAVEAMLADQPEVVLVQSQAGFEPGMKFGGGTGVMGSTQGFISVTLTPRTERERSIWEIEQEVRHRIDAIPGLANVLVKEVGNTAKPTTVAPIVARITGPDPLVLDRLGDQVVERLETVPALVQPMRGWRRDMERVVVDVDVLQAASLGASPVSVARHLATGAEGVPAGTWTSEVRSPEPILVRFARSDRAGVDAHLAWPMFVAGGEVLPARAIAEPVIVVEQGLFTTENLSPVLDVRAEISDGPLSFAVADAEAAVEELVVPAGYRVTIEGENKDLVESRVSILRALAISVLAVYLLLVAQFRSWLQPLTVMMAIPLSLVGVSAALWVTDNPVSMPVMVGLVLLVGTVVNNSILLVDVIRQQRAQGVDRRAAIRASVESRFRPIMMTSLSTMIGMLPLALELALGAERFSPLAKAVIGGLLASTLLTMVVIPVLYDIIDSMAAPRVRGGAVVATALVVAALLVPASARAGDEGIEQAWSWVQDHPALQASSERVRASEARTRAATGRLFPEVELTARTTRRDPFDPASIQIPIVLPDGSSPDPMQLGDAWDTQHFVGATATQPLFAGGQVLHGRKALAALEGGARAQRDATEGELWLALSEAWYGHAVATSVVGIRHDVVVAALEREASLQRLLSEGRAVELQLSAVALKRAEAEQAEGRARADAAVAYRGLTALLGREVDAAGVDVVMAAGARLGRPMPDGHSARVDEAEGRANAARARGKAATGALLPTLAVRASAQYSNPDLTQFPVRNEWGTYWDASLVMRWTLDAGVRWGEARAARLDAHAAELATEALARQEDVARAGALATVEMAAQQLRVAAERVRLAEHAASVADTALENGRTTPAEVLDRRADLAMARAAELRVALEALLAVETARVQSGVSGPAAP